MIHPSEPVADYEGFTTDFDRQDKVVRLVVGEYMWDVLNATDILIQRLSTTAVEAWFTGIDTLELLTMDNYDDFFLRPLYAEGSYVVSNGRELSDTIERIRGGVARPAPMEARRREYIEYLCHKVDGQVHVRIAEAILEFLETHPNEPRMKPGVWDARWAAEALTKLVFRLPMNLTMPEIVRRVLFRQKVEDYLGRFDKTVTDEAIEHWCDHWDEGSGLEL